MVLAGIGLAGLVLLVVFLGSIVLAGGLLGARRVGTWQVTLAAKLLGAGIARPGRFQAGPGLFGWLRSAFTDRAAWRSLAYTVAKIPLSIFGREDETSLIGAGSTTSVVWRNTFRFGWFSA